MKRFFWFHDNLNPGDRYVVEDKNMADPKKCLNCGSENLFEHRYVGGGIEIRVFFMIKQQAIICVDCGYTMLFTRDEHKDRVHKEFKKRQ